MRPPSLRILASTGKAVMDIAVPLNTKKEVKATLAYLGSEACRGRGTGKRMDGGKDGREYEVKKRTGKRMDGSMR